MRSQLAALLVLAASLAPAAARADVVVVLGIQSMEGDDEYARSLTLAVRTEAARVPDWTMSDRNVTLSQMLLAFGCDEANADCLGQIATTLGAQRVIFGEVARTSPSQTDYNFQVSLRLFDAVRHELVGPAEATLPGAQRDIDDLRTGALRLVGVLSGAPQVGIIEFATNAPDAEVRIDGAVVGRTDAQGRLRIADVQAGSRVLEIASADGAAHRQTVELAAHDAARIDVELAPGQASGDGTPPPPEVPDEPPSGESPPRPRADPVGLYVGIALLGAGAVLAGLWIGSMSAVGAVQNDPMFADYRARIRTGTDACETAAMGFEPPGAQAGSAAHAAAGCSEASTWSALQFVFLVSGAAALGVGAYLLLDALLGTPAADARVRLLPGVSPEGGSLTLAFTD